LSEYCTRCGGTGHLETMKDEWGMREAICPNCLGTGRKPFCWRDKSETTDTGKGTSEERKTGDHSGGEA